MGQIFRKSYGTHIWLDSLSMTGSFAKSFRTYWIKLPTKIDDEERFRLLENFLYCSIELKVSESRRTLRQDATELFKHEYWRRLWVVQEVILSQTISIVLGDVVLNLDLILRSLYDSPPYSRSHISGAFEDEYLDYTLQRLGTNRMDGVDERQSFSLLALVSEYKAHGCKDIRDRIYGLLALTDMHDRIIVDYNCHVAALFTSTLESYVAGLKDFGPKRENIHMYDVKSLMRALHLDPDVLIEYQNQETTAPNFSRCFKISMFPTVAYTVICRRHQSTFSRLIDANDGSTNTNLRMHADGKQDHLHKTLMGEIYDLDSSDLGARYLLCSLPLSGFETLLHLRRTGNVTLIGTIERNGKANIEGKLLTPYSMPTRVLDSINIELNASKREFHRAAFKQKVKWPGYIVNCSVEGLVHLQGSHDLLDTRSHPD